MRLNNVLYNAFYSEEKQSPPWTGLYFKQMDISIWQTAHLQFIAIMIIIRRVDFVFILNLVTLLTLPYFLPYSLMSAA